MRALLALMAVLAVACGGEAPVAPTPTPTPIPATTPPPTPAPSRITINATLTDTVSGAVIGASSQDVAALPATITVSAGGHLARTTRVATATPTIDLIADSAPFSLTFYRQLARNAFDDPAAMRPLFMLSQAPSFYLQTTGLSGGTISRFISAIREVVPAMTGGRFAASTIEMGDELRADQPGWITIEIVPKDDLLINGTQACGSAYIGRPSGHVRITTGLQNGCGLGPDPLAPVILQHEVAHALGFFHIDLPGSLMFPGGPGSYQWQNTKITDGERYHASVAYRRQAGNSDPDIDPTTATPLRITDRLAFD